jgi:arylsulfotransferase ASST
MKRHPVQRIFLISVLFIVLFFSNHANAGIRPVNDAQLHYTQIMFEYDEVNGADRYVVTITPLKDPNAKPIVIENRTLACMVSDFRFGKTYFWHYEAFTGSKQIFKSDEFKFTIVSNYLVDSNLFSCPVEITKPGQFNDDIIFIDYRGIAIDRKGKPVWYFPVRNQNPDQDPLFRNLRMTNDGTLTFLDDSSCYEVDVDGNNLWKAPDNGKISGDAKEHYHHDFKKLEDGTYLTLGWKYEYEKNLYNPALRCQVRYNTLIQYDSKGKIIWYWNEKDHIPREVIYGVYSGTDSIISGTHMNAIDYSPMENTIIASCRHNSSIIKIDKKTGKVIYTVGVYDNKMKAQGIEPLFLHQHGMAFMPDQQFVFYDNYVPDDPNHGVTYPRVIIFKEPSKNLPAYKTWEYECKSSHYPDGITGKGGYVMPLPNGNLLVCMGGANYAFEINLKKEIVWQCDFQKFDSYNKNWIDYISYRCTSASSLYPYYFTLQQATKDNSLYSFKLNNEGTENDSYQIEVTADGKKIASETVEVSKQSSRQINVPVKSKNASKEIAITVSRKSNSGQSKKLSFNKQASNLSTSSIQ